MHFNRGQVLLDQLMLADRLAMLLTLPGVSDRFGQAILDDAKAARGDAQPAAHERAHGDAEALPFLAKQVCGRHLVVGQLEHGGVGGRHAHLGCQIFAGEAGPTGVDDEGADAAGAALGIGKRNNDVGDAGVGDQVLDAIEQILVPLALVRHLHFQRVAAGLGLR